MGQFVTLGGADLDSGVAVVSAASAHMGASREALARSIATLLAVSLRFQRQCRLSSVHALTFGATRAPAWFSLSGLSEEVLRIAIHVWSGVPLHGQRQVYHPSTGRERVYRRQDRQGGF